MTAIARAETGPKLPKRVTTANGACTAFAEIRR